MTYVAYRACCLADILDIDYAVADRGRQRKSSWRSAATWQACSTAVPLYPPRLE